MPSTFPSGPHAQAIKRWITRGRSSGLALALLLVACRTSAETAPARVPAVIPAPVELHANEGAGFTINAQTQLITVSAPPETDALLRYIHSLVGPATGFALPDGTATAAMANVLVLDFDAAHFPAALRTTTSNEAYALTVDANHITLHAATTAGMFYGIQTLRQLLPPELERRAPVSGITWSVPAVTIRDEPRFKWRGLLLDVGRHFFTVDQVKTFIDLMALQKLNVLHWHLTDDQGWRIEIKKYPRLTEVGGWREESPLRTDRKRGDGVRYGGFYTQDQIRDVVAYANARFITVMPEIELPGHAAAAIAAYPQLGNSDIPGYSPRVMTRWGVHPYTYAPKEETFTFLEDVLREVIALFPSRYIHIGGDEAPKTQWHDSPVAQAFIKQQELKDEHELQSRFIARIGRFLAANQRKLVGWDEIQEGGTPPGAVVMLWRTRPEKGADPKLAAGWQNLWAPLRSGHEIILTPNTHFYLDHYQADPKTSPEPMAIGGLDTLEHVYSFEPPYSELTQEESGRILGMEGTLWTEYIWDFPKLQYMAFPRACAVAEVAWSTREGRNFAQFETRLDVFQRRLDELGVLYRKPGTRPLQVIQ